MNNPAKPTMAGPKKHAGIRSLLGADNSNSNEPVKPIAVDATLPVTTAGMTLMEVLKNNIEEAIRHDSDLQAGYMSMNQPKPAPFTGVPGKLWCSCYVELLSPFPTF